MVLGSCNGTALQRYCGVIKFSRALDSALSRPRISHVGYERTTFAETDNMLCGAKLAATDRHTHCCCAKLTGIAVSAFSPSGRFLVQHDIISPLSLIIPSFPNPYFAFKGTLSDYQGRIRIPTAAWPWTKGVPLGSLFETP